LFTFICLPLIGQLRIVR